MNDRIIYDIMNNNNGTITLSVTDGTIVKKSTINNEFIAVVQDVDEIDPIMIIQNVLKENLTKEQKYEV